MFRTVRIVVVVLCVSAALALITSAVAVGAPGVAAVSADVVGSDGLPIDGASVDVSVLKGGTYRPLAELATGDSGELDMTVKPASYRLDVSAPSADPETVYLTAERAGVYELEIQLESYGNISGTILDNLSGDPVPGALVGFYLQGEDGTWPESPTFSIVATDGTYATGAIAAGSYHVSAGADGYASGFYDGWGLGTPTVVVNRGAEVTGIDIPITPLAQSGTISGRVVNGASATPMNGVFVFMYKRNADGTWPATTPSWGAPTRTVYTTTDGTYSSGDLPFGEYRVRFFTIHTGSQWWEYVTTVDAATVLTLSTPGETIADVDGWFNKPL